jgi:hypothetical protein
LCSVHIQGTLGAGVKVTKYLKRRDVINISNRNGTIGAHGPLYLSQSLFLSHYFEI